MGVLSGLVAERGGVAVADPRPQRDRALQLGSADERFGAEFPGVEADGAHIVTPARRLVAFHQVSQWGAAITSHPGGDAPGREPDGFLGEEHERRAAGFGRSHSHEERHGDLLGIFQPGTQADDCLAWHRHASFSKWYPRTGPEKNARDAAVWCRRGFPLRI